MRTFLIVLFSLLPLNILTADVTFDRGDESRLRHFQSSDRCKLEPCVLTHHGAIRISKEDQKKYQIEIGSIHRGAYRSLIYFQQSTSFEQKVSERIFNRAPNRKIVNLGRALAASDGETIFVYGLSLQHEIDEAEAIILKLTSFKDPADVKEYYFRYHHDAVRWDLDLAFIQPVNLFYPNRSDIIQAAYSTAAFSLSFGKPLDPEKSYNFISKFSRAVRLNVLAGLLIRTDVASFQGDRITKDYIDGFGGLGLTFFNFLAVGYGINFVRSPHAGFPFVGLEIRHFSEFLSSLKKDTHTRWQQYLDEEQKN